MAAPSPPPPPALPGVCGERFASPIEDTDLTGADVSNLASTHGGTPPHTDCCTACLELASCEGFVEFGGHCYLKSGALTPSANAGRLAYLRLTNPPPLPLSSSC